MRYVARRFLVILVAILAGALLGGLVGGVLMSAGWGEGMIFGGIGGAILSTLYDPRATTYTVPTHRGAQYPGNRDDYTP